MDPNFERLVLNGIDFKFFYYDDNSFLVGPITEEEIWNCDGKKSPGPDGFNVNFIKDSAEVVKDDITGFRNFSNLHSP